METMEIVNLLNKKFGVELYRFNPSKPDTIMLKEFTPKEVRSYFIDDLVTPSMSISPRLKAMTAHILRDNDIRIDEVGLRQVRVINEQ